MSPVVWQCGDHEATVGLKDPMICPTCGRQHEWSPATRAKVRQILRRAAQQLLDEELEQERKAHGQG